jgi:hypothetical protein
MPRWSAEQSPLELLLSALPLFKFLWQIEFIGRLSSVHGVQRLAPPAAPGTLQPEIGRAKQDMRRLGAGELCD